FLFLTAQLETIRHSNFHEEILDLGKVVFCGRSTIDCRNRILGTQPCFRRGRIGKQGVNPEMLQVLGKAQLQSAGIVRIWFRKSAIGFEDQLPAAVIEYHVEAAQNSTTDRRPSCRLAVSFLDLETAELQLFYSGGNPFFLLPQSDPCGYF